MQKIIFFALYIFRFKLCKIIFFIFEIFFFIISVFDKSYTVWILH